MKSLSVLLVLAALGLAACGNSSNASSGDPASAPQQKVYECPMHCVPEGQTEEYTSHEPGRCPVCGMELQERE